MAVERELSPNFPKPCEIKSETSSGSVSGKRRWSAHKKKYVKATCEELVGIADKYGLPCGTSSVKTETVFEGLSTKLKISQSDFLNDLNRFIARELEERYSVKVNHSEDEETRQVKTDIKLRIFKEAFFVVQNSVPTYRTVLERIMCAYDEAIHIRDKRLEELKVLKSALLKMQKDVEAQKSSIWEDAMAKVITLLREKQDLIEIIDAVTVDKNNMRRTIEELGKELEYSQTKLMEEIDARRLVAYEYTQLSAQVEILRNKALAVAQTPEKTADVDSANDPVLLRMALDKSREALAKAQAKIAHMEAVYDSVCPLRDYNALQSLYQELKKTNTKLTGHIAALEKKVQNSETQLEQCKIDKQHLEYKLSNFQKSGTPRFDWNICAQFVQGGLEEWTKLTEGKRSSEKFNIFIEQLSQPQDYGESYFLGRGKNSNVPLYLKYEGRVLNRRYRLRDVRIIINDIWSAKLSSNNREPLSVYLSEYAENSFPLSVLRAELVYNLEEGCKRYSSDPQVKLFYGILWGQLQEEIYISQRAEMEVLKRELLNKMQGLGSKTSLTGAGFCETVRQTFPFKSETEVMALLEAATTQLQISIGKSLNIAELFTECEEGLEQRELGREMGEQFRSARKKFATDVLNSVLEFENSMENSDGVSVETVRKAFNAADPNLENHKLESYLKWLFSLRSEDSLEKATEVPFSVLALRLEQGDIGRTYIKKSASVEYPPTYSLTGS